MIKAIKVIERCPECWMGIMDSCPKCHGMGEVEGIIDFPTFIEYVGEALEKHYHLHNKGQ